MNFEHIAPLLQLLPLSTLSRLCHPSLYNLNRVAYFYCFFCFLIQLCSCCLASIGNGACPGVWSAYHQSHREGKWTLSLSASIMKGLSLFVKFLYQLDSIFNP